MRVSPSRSFGTILLLLSVFQVFSQDLPRIAVIPFNPINVSKADAEILSELFETALVKTESFNVIEQNRVSEILEAQEFSISDCTDEKCAVEFGKLLAAEQIVIGTYSSIAGKYVLNAKIIDVQQGKNLRADTVSVDDPKEVTNMAGLLAFKLAGLTYTAGSDVKVAESFGEVFVESEPAGADIYINGVKKGVSPELFSRIPVGTVRIEARSGDLYAKIETTVGSRMETVKLNLTKKVGNLFIRSPEPDMEVFIGDTALGKLGSGIFQNILVGEYLLSLRGNGLYWEGKVAVEDGKVTRVEASPRAFGTIEYNLPDGVQAEVTGKDYREVVRGSGSLSPVWKGAYTANTHGGEYVPITSTLTVEKAATVRFEPELVLSEKGKKDKELAEITLKLSELSARRSNLAERIKIMDAKNAANRTSVWISLGVGVVSLAGMGASIYLGQEPYKKYTATTITADAIKYRSETELYQYVSIGLGSVGGIAALLSAILPAFGENPAQQMSELQIVELQIRDLEARKKALDGE